MTEAPMTGAAALSFIWTSSMTLVAQFATSLDEANALCVSRADRLYRVLVAEELYAAHVAGSDTATRQDRFHCFDHGGWSGEVIHRRRRVVNEALELVFVEH